MRRISRALNPDCPLLSLMGTTICSNLIYILFVTMQKVVTNLHSSAAFLRPAVRLLQQLVRLALAAAEARMQLVDALAVYLLPEADVRH